MIPSPSANPDLPHRLVRIRLGLAHTPAFLHWAAAPLPSPGQGRGAAAPVRKKEMAPPPPPAPARGGPPPRASTEKGNAAALAEAKLPLAKKRFVCYTECILRMERFSERVKAWATDLNSTVRNCSGGPALAGLCSAAEFRSLRHLSPCFSI